MPKEFSDTNFEIGDKLKVPTIHFNLSGGGGVINEHIDFVKVVANFLKENPNIKIEIGVHMDSRGTEEMSFKISQIRADGMKDLLENTFNISLDRVLAIGYGESAPLITHREILAAGSSEEQEALHLINRRIEVTIIEK